MAKKVQPPVNPTPAPAPKADSRMTIEQKFIKKETGELGPDKKPVNYIYTDSEGNKVNVSAGSSLEQELHRKFKLKVSK